jgi:hypothetical protein
MQKHGYWKTHHNKELQRLLMELHFAGWRIKDPPKYYKALCPCPAGHMKTIHLTPSDPYYENKVRQYLKNHTCFRFVGKVWE